MATGRINKSGVDSAKPAERDWFLWDDKLSGFGLKVTPSGGKIFIFQYRIGGRGAKVRRYTLGKFGNLTPDAARKHAEELARQVSKGVDPQAEKVSKARQAVDLAFKSYAQSFVDDCLKLKWKASHADGEAHLRLHITPHLKNKPLPQINRSDIRAILRPLKDKPATARYTFAVLRRLFRWAVSQGDLQSSPMDGMESPPAPASRDRALSDDELKIVWCASEGLGYPFRSLVRLLILTGARRDEIADLEWSELDLATRKWTLPAERAKNRTSLITALPDRAIEELEYLAKRAGREKDWPRKGFVLSTTGKTGVSGFSRAKARLDKRIAKMAKEDGLTVEPWRLHDLRRTLATGMQRLGVRFEVTEAILNHVSGSRSGVAGIYQRHDWASEKAAALQAWSDHLGLILADNDQTNVVPLITAGS